MKFIVALLVTIWFVMVVLYVSALVKTHQECDGQVVRNTWNWPVCVESR